MTRLEGQFDKLRDENTLLRDRIADLSQRVAVLNEKVAVLPSKGFIVGGLITMLTAIAALTAFADKLQSLLK